MKLIAEPWDLGEGGYQVGNFPPQWAEWNGKYRDCVRDFWRGENQILGEFCYRFSGSSDLYETTGRRPYASVNFVTAHDGFTLNDLVSYNEKHNESNDENNRDGENHNRSWNCGAEGPTEDHEILELRAKQKRNLLTSLFLSQGAPMLLSGDEISRTQNGNNNAYCQDNETSWHNWENIDGELLEFTRRLVQFRKDHPAFRQRGWFLGRAIRGSDRYDIAWFSANGTEMSEEDWREGSMKSIGIFLNGKAIAAPNLNGERVLDDVFYIIFTASHEFVTFRLPPAKWGKKWLKIMDTSKGGWLDDYESHSCGKKLKVDSRSAALLVLLDKK